MPRTLADELNDWAEHGRWVAYLKAPPAELPKDQKDTPRARFKDCANCPEREGSTSEAERRELCAACPYEEAGLPDNLSVRAWRAMDLADEPPEAIALIIRDLSNQERRDWYAVRMWQASRMMGAGILG